MHLPKKQKFYSLQDMKIHNTAMYEALKALLAARELKLKCGKTDTYKCMAAHAWEKAEQAVFLVET